eukprot:c11126_g1_i2.p1 GENE.c11126_g1_i2~~c11126_g1_i2.p1  ORF type:complete len:440 (-),score=100.89 c11126_g1_i2:398-1717(-)
MATTTVTQAQDTLLDGLGEDVMSVVVGHLNLLSLCTLSCCNRRMNAFVKKERIWELMCQDHLGLSDLPPYATTWHEAYVLTRPMVGDVIAVLDFHNNWAPARIIAVARPNLILVHLEVKHVSPSVFSAMWMHLSHDRYRMRPVTEDLLQNLYETIDSDMFEKLRNDTAQRVQSNLSRWPLPNDSSIVPWIYLKQRQSTLPIEISIQNIPLWEAQQKQRESFTPTRLLLPRLHLLPRVPVPCREKGLWVSKVLRFSSEYDTVHWTAHHTKGPPKVYPRYGDIYGAWAPRASKGAKEFLEVEFDCAIRIKTIHIFETFNPGAIVLISAMPEGSSHWVPIFEDQPRQLLLPAESRIFCPQLTNKNIVSKKLRIDMDTNLSRSWSEIDAIRIFDEEGVEPSIDSGVALQSKEDSFLNAPPTPNPAPSGLIALLQNWTTALQIN